MDEEETMMVPVRPPRGMSDRQVTMLRRLYTMHIDQQEAIFAESPSPAPARDVVVASSAEARRATCRVCFAETYEPDGRERPNETPRPEALVAPCNCDGSQKWVHVCAESNPSCPCSCIYSMAWRVTSTNTALARTTG